MSDDQERTIDNKARFLKVFRKKMGIITLTCEEIGIERQTYYNWMEKDDEFKVKVKEILNIQCGIVEDILLGLITKGKESSVQFYLRKKHPDYKDKLELAGELRTNPYAGYTKEQLETEIKRLTDSEASANGGETP